MSYSKKITCLDHYGRKYVFRAHQFFQREAVYGICFVDGKIVLVQDSKSNQWELPGGGKDGIETDYECLKREFFEETGFHIGKGMRMVTEDTSYFYDVASQQPWHTSRKFYSVSVDSGTLSTNGNGDDIRQAKCVHLEKLSSLKCAKTVSFALQENALKEC